MFIEPNSTVKVTIYYKRTGHTYIAFLKKDLRDNKKLSDKDKESLLELNVTMKVLTWDLFNQIQERGWVPNPEDNSKMTWSNKASKEFKLFNLIIDWDAKDKDGNPIKVTKERIASLAPEIAEAILDGYEDSSYLTKEEEGKIGPLALKFLAGFNKTGLPADIMRSLIEINLAKEFGWTVKEINETPYKWIQKYYFLDQIMNNASEIKSKSKAASQNTSSPFPQKFRNVIPGVTPGVPGKSSTTASTKQANTTKGKEKK